MFIVFVALRFVGGKLNMCYNAVDRHVESGRGEQPAIIFDSPVTGIKQVITFRELQAQVNHILQKSLKVTAQRAAAASLFKPDVKYASSLLLPLQH